MISIKTKEGFLTLVSRVFLFTFIWWALSDGSIQSWWIGTPAVLLAVIASIALIPTTSLVWHALPGFVPFFISRSLLGGIDVAWRAFHPNLPIAPDIVEYPLHLPPGLPRVFMAITVNLLPGTLSTELDPNLMKVHVLDRQKDLLVELKAVEQHVARLFGISLNTHASGGLNEQV